MGFNVILISALGVTALALVLLIGVFIQRMMYHRSKRRHLRGISEVQPMIVGFILGEASRAELYDVARRNRTAARELVLHHLTYLNGSIAEELLSFATDMGFIDSAVHNASSSSWRQREIAAMEMGVYKLEATVPVLEKLLDDPKREVRHTAARSLAIIGSRDSLEALLRLITGKGRYITPRLLEIVHQVPRYQIGSISELLTSGAINRESRLLLVDLAGDWREHRLTRALHELLESDDTEIVIRVIKALSRIGDPDSIPVLLLLTDHPKWEVRAQVVRAVAQFDYVEAIPLIREALADQAYWVRRAAAESLVQLGDEGRRYLNADQEYQDRFARDMVTYHRQKLNLPVTDREAAAISASSA